MHIELTEQQRLLAQQGQPVDLIDSQTNEAYVLIARQQFEQVRAQLVCSPLTAKPAYNLFNAEIPEGIRVSQETFRRDLPGLLEQKKLFRQWAAYHRNERIGIGPRQQSLIDECFKLGLAEDEFYVGWIDVCELEVEEEIEPRWHHYGEGLREDS